MAISEEDGMLYEINERGQRVVVKSLNSTLKSYVRFSNRTTRPVNVYWRDFHGNKRHYACVQPYSVYDVDTFLTHPWEFQDAATDENFLVNNSIIFRAPQNTGGMRFRTNWNISLPLRTLRATAMLAVASYIRNIEDVGSLELPKSLEEEVKEVVAKLRGVQDGR